MTETPKTMTVLEWRAQRTKTSPLQGFFTLQTPAGMIYRNCAYFERPSGTRWVSTPAQKYSKADNSTGWVNLVDFVDRPTRDRFQAAALAALDRFFKLHPDTRRRNPGLDDRDSA
jgi:hypothetical protein